MKTELFPYSDKALGAIYTKDHTVFNVWAPTQETLRLAIYDSAKAPFRTLYPMTKAEDGVFSVRVEGDLHGMYYTYIINGQTEVTDPYSVSTSANSLRSAIVDLDKTNPKGWKKHSRPKGIKGCDSILYEVHVGDFSAHANSGMMNKGKFLAFTENDTSIENCSTGLDHLTELGITHVHLMPVYDYLTVDEEIVEDKNYNWGYDPEHFNVPEGSYATDPNNPVARIMELKQAVKALHEKGLKVVLDVVYNHTYRTEHSNFNCLVPKYYHRITEDGHFSNGSGCGNEFASENPMARRFLIDSLIYWVEEFKIDGFRFDLMALIDLETIKLAEERLREIDPEILIYGEPWMGGLSTLPDNQRVYKGAQCDQRFSLFNDDFRDAIKGDNDGAGKGFIQGNKDAKHKIHTGIVGSIAFDEKYIGFTTHPCESINYFNSHDNLILQDKLKKASPNASYDELIHLNKMAFNLLFMSQGIPFFHAGNEFLRDKKGYHNSYNAPFSINAIDWKNKVRYKEVFEYVKDLIKLRKTYSCFRLKTAEEIKEKIHFIEDDEYLEAFKDGIVYIIKQSSDEAFECMLVAHNPSHDQMLLSVSQLKDTILCIYANGNRHLESHKKHQMHHKTHPDVAKSKPSHIKYEGVKKLVVPNENIFIERIFDERGLLSKPESIDPNAFHLVNVKPMSSAVFKLGRINRE